MEIFNKKNNSVEVNIKIVENTFHLDDQIIQNSSTKISENNKNIEVSKNESIKNENKKEEEEEKPIINLIPISEPEEKTSPKNNNKEEIQTSLFSNNKKIEKENENEKEKESIFTKKLFENNSTSNINPNNFFLFSNNKTEKSENNTENNQPKNSFSLFSNNNNEKSKSLFTFTFLTNNNNNENNNNKFTPFLFQSPNNDNNNSNTNILNNNSGNIFSNLINNTNDKKDNNKKELFNDEENNDEDDDDEADKPKTKYVSDPLKAQDYSDYVKIFNKHINNFYLYNSKEKIFTSKGNGFFSIEKTKDETKKQVVVVFRNQTGIKLVEGFLDKKFEKIEINSKNFDFLLSFGFLMVNEKKETEFGFAKIPFTDEGQAELLKKAFEEAFAFMKKE